MSSAAHGWLHQWGITRAERAAVGWASDGNSARRLGQYQTVYAAAQWFQDENRRIDIFYIYLQFSGTEANTNTDLCST